MERSKPLRRDGPGARRFADQRSPLTRRQPIARAREIPRTTSPRTGATSGGKPRARAVNRAGPTDDERAAVAARSGGRCEVGGPQCMERATDVHHRNRDRTDNRLDNLVHCCTWCHLRWVHGESRRSLDVGWLISRFADCTTLPPLPPRESP